MKSKRAVVDPVTLGLVAIFALGGGSLLANWHPLEFLRGKPPTEQLAKLQADLAKAQADAEQARKEKDQAIAAERLKNDQQGKSIQESNALALAAAQSVPEAKRTAETRLTEEMIERTDSQLATQLGTLPQNVREGLVNSIAKALNGQRAAFDAEIAKKDADFKAISVERDALMAQIPVLTQKAVKAEETAKATQVEVTVKTNQVAAIADKLDAEKRQSGSLGSALNSAKNVILGVSLLAAIGYGLFLWTKRQYGSIPQALGKGMAEFRVRHPEGAAILTGILDTNFNRNEQKLVATHAQS